ncbi:MAG: hypothetical protein LBS74_06560 [Oscillospiraceae bacterium]|nr:hypothetical protein [Oscillospiraceae bacterium]
MIAVLFIFLFGNGSSKNTVSSLDSASQELILPSDFTITLELADTEITDLNKELGKAWVSFDASRDLVNDTYCFFSNGKYEHRLKYSTKAGGKYESKSGQYSVPEKGTLVLYPDAAPYASYNYKIEGDALYLKELGAAEWSCPYTLSEAD